MSQILFKRGTQAGLDSLQNIQDGTFYVTEDSHRLYLGIKKDGEPLGKVVPLGSVMNVVSTVEDLPVPTPENFNSLYGELYFISTLGTLLTINENGVWMVLNRDDNTYVTEHYTVLTSQSGNNINGVTVEDFVEDSAGKYHISKWNLNGDNTLSFTVEGTGSGTDRVYSVTIANELKLLIPSSTEKGLLQLGVQNEDPISEIDIVGTSGISISSGQNDETGRNEIIVDASELKNQLIDKIENKFDANGNLTTTLTQIGKGEISSEAITPTIYYGDAIDETTSEPVNSAVYKNGKAVLSVYTKAEIDNKIANQFTNMDAVRYMGTIGLPETLSSPTWKPISALQIIKPSNPNIGDAYKITVDRTYTNYGRYMPVGSKLDELEDRQEGEEWAYKGDLLIANGTEATENNSDRDEVIGVITPTSFKWDYVPSGDDFDTTYTGKVITNGIELIENQYGGNQETVLSLSIRSGSDNEEDAEGQGTASRRIVVEDLSDEDDSTANTVIISHELITTATDSATTNDTTQDRAAPQTNGYYAETTITTLKNYTADGYGHITEFDEAEIKLIDTNATLKSNSYSISSPEEGRDGYEKQATITNTVILQHYNDSAYEGDAKSSSFILDSDNDNLKLKTTDTSVAFSLEWGTF